MKAAPIRFLVLVLGLWICARAVILAPGLWIGQGKADPTPPSARQTLPFVHPAEPAAAAAADPMPAASPGKAAAQLHSLIRHFPYKGAEGRPGTPVSVPAVQALLARLAPGSSAASPLPFVHAGEVPAPGPAQIALSNRPRSSSRWSGAAWLLARRDRGGAALAPGGTLGGSQAGARISYRLAGGLSLAARAYLPLGRKGGAEAALGLDWRPVSALPVNIIAERRQALGRDGRSAFALTLYGGASRALPHRLRLDAYGQAGVVGARSRDLFADGAVRVSAPVGPVEVGAGAWGAAQPGATRLDVGPIVAYRLPMRGVPVRIEVGWRFRLAGDAAPRSGPALTLGVDF